MHNLLAHRHGEELKTTRRKWHFLLGQNWSEKACQSWYTLQASFEIMCRNAVTELLDMCGGSLPRWTKSVQQEPNDSGSHVPPSDAFLPRAYVGWSPAVWIPQQGYTFTPACFCTIHWIKCQKRLNRLLKSSCVLRAWYSTTNWPAWSKQRTAVSQPWGS